MKRNITLYGFMFLAALVPGCRKPREHGVPVQIESIDRNAICTYEGIDVSIGSASSDGHSIIRFGTHPVVDYADLRRLLKMAKDDWAKVGRLDMVVVTLTASKDVQWSDVFALITAIQQEGFSRIEFLSVDPFK